MRGEAEEIEIGEVDFAGHNKGGRAIFSSLFPLLRSFSSSCYDDSVKRAIPCSSSSKSSPTLSRPAPTFTPQTL